MPDYQRMYALLCAGVSKVLDDMEGQEAIREYYRRLEALLHQAEDIYIKTAE